MYCNVILKMIILYFYIVLCYKIMGKKEVGNLNIVDLIVSILIASVAAISIYSNKSILMSVLPILVLVIIQVILSYLSLKSNKIRKFLDGSPRVIVNNGKVNFNLMQKLRYTLDDLVSQLREQGIKSIEEVKYAILENNGKLSVFKTSSDYPMAIIIDGVIDIDTIKNMNKDLDWVYKILDKNKLKLKDVFYAFYTKEKTYIIKK